MVELWRDYKTSLHQRYGQRVYRIGLDGGFSCPNRSANRGGGCIYCDAKGSSAVYQRRDESRYNRSSAFVENIDQLGKPEPSLSLEDRKHSLTDQINHGSHFLDTRYPDSAKSIYFQAFTSTYDDPEVLKQLYDHALQTGEYRELIVSTRPDCLEDTIVGLLASYRDRVDAVWVELGLQSGNDATLRWIGRGHTVSDYLDACVRLHAAGIEISTHVILGFPQEGDAEILNTAKVIAQSHPEAIKIHNLHVVAGTRLYDRYIAEDLPVSDMAEHVRQTILLLRHIPADIVIQRFLSDTPSHRLAAPRDFGDKNTFTTTLRNEMVRLGATQGDAL
ncbi:MAG: TIGR01212 family radical SAM protein [Sphaerochaetaceae bacterium]